MGCPSGCGGKKAQQASVAAPYEITVADGRKVTVNNKVEERVARDQAYVRVRDQARRDGFRIQR